MHSPVNWALLGLVIERPSYAYELARRFERVYDGALSLSSVSHIYMALPTLLERGLIEELLGDQQARRSRRRYQATELGVAEHAQWVVGQVAEEQRRQQVLVTQLGVVARDPQRARDLLDAYEQACLTEIAEVAPDGERTPGTTGLVTRLLGEQTRLGIGAKLRWAQYARTELSALTQPAEAPPDAPQE
ncbi:MAG TPA: PadR family transcriptional regulator [Solirubrobacteraceae bacterium]|nr:PadR family transcriptional regulator [Solirubrobacteraceae bacterium]